MFTPREQTNRLLLRARDEIDRRYDEPLDVASLARVALMSEAHFIRSFGATFGEPPHRYLQRRRIERAMALLREPESGLTIGEVCVDVGFASVSSFTRTFRAVVGVSPSSYRSAGGHPSAGVPTCFAKAWMRPSSFGQARGPGAA